MIPNIAKGKGITGALAYCMGQGNDAETGARLELQEGEASRAVLLGGQNFGIEIDTAERLDLARRIMEWQGLPENQAGKTRQLERDCFHASLSWGDGQRPDRAEMVEAAQQFLKAVGLEKARAVFIAHEDTDHAHVHIVASRIDPETGRSLRLDNDYIAAQKWALDWEKAHGQERAHDSGLHALAEAVAKRDAGAILDHLTAQKSTFQVWELNRVLSYGDLSAEERAGFKADILARPDVIGLRETAQGPVTRYTTRGVLAEEMGLQRSAAAVAADKGHGLTAARVEKAVQAFTLKSEQATALRHLTGAEGLGILWGEAGTGKSHTLNAARSAYEASGREVIGLSWTNDVVQQMHGDGFANCGTVASQLYAHDKGRSGWNANTVLIVDEAAMLSTGNLSRLMKAAETTGAKLILAGDDAQLPSIERGGMFETLRQRHGAAILKDVQRVADAGQQAAFNEMHGHKFAKALQTFEERGGLHWTTSQSQAVARMAQDYVAAVAADPSKRRFMFAHTNKDVAALNTVARGYHRSRGDLGDDRSLPTKDGEAVFATGDRIQFTGNGYGQAAKQAGLVNGRVGTVAGIENAGDGKSRLTVALDGKKGAEPKAVSFVVGGDEKRGEFDAFKHGYAGTVYRGQGKTLDQTFVAYNGQMRSASAYVALTRHREDVHIYAARETVKDRAAIAKGFERSGNKRAATAYHIDRAELASVEQALAAAGRGPRGAATAERKRLTKIERADEAATAEDLKDERNPFAGAKAFGLAARALGSIFAALMGELPTARPLTAQERREAKVRTAAEREDADRAARRSRYFRDYGVDMNDEQQQSAELGRGGRERTRGE